MGLGQTPIYVYKSGRSGDGAFLDLASVFDGYATLSFTHGFNAPGTFSITVDRDTALADQLTVGRIIQIGTDAEKNGIITTVRLSLDKSGKTVKTITGMELWGVLGRRQVDPEASAYFSLADSTPIETVVKTMISKNIGATATAKRKINSLNLLTDQARGLPCKVSERWSNVLESISRYLVQTYSGLCCTLNHTTTKWDLEWCAGTDRTSSVIFSSSNGTIATASATDSDETYKNLIIIGGQGVGAARTIRQVYSGTEPEDLDRREIFRDARDLSTTASLDARASQLLVENGFQRFIEIEPQAYSKYIYGRDYFVGDYVTFQEFGLSQSVQIIEVNEQWDSSGYSIKMSVDKSIQSVARQISTLSAMINQGFTTTEV